MVQAIINLLLLTLQASASTNSPPIPKTPEESFPLNSTSLFQDPVLPFDSERNQTLPSSSFENSQNPSRSLLAPCTDGQSGCKTCDSSNNYCLKCQDPSQLPNTAGGCSAATLSTCTYSASSYLCTDCQSNYYTDCMEPCPNVLESCATYTGTGFCTPCDTGYYKAQDGTCVRCGSGCSVCEDYEIYKRCGPGYYLNVGVCSKCMNNCKSCVISTVCNECNSGYGFNLVAGTCVPTSLTNCNLNSTGTGCVSCLTGYTKTSTSSVCTTKCSDVIAGCTDCYYASYVQCTACNTPGYWFNPDFDTVCQLCTTYDANCATCDSSSCITCKTGYIIATNKKCKSVIIDGCKEVDTSTPPKCNGKCLDNYFWYDYHLACYNCAYYMPLCKTCTDSSTCTQCEDGYNLKDSSTCIKSPFQHCDLVLDGGTCITCSYGYQHGCALTVTNSIHGCKKAYPHNKFCMECNPNYQLVEADGTCACTAKNCDVCNANDGSKCDQCSDGYYEGVIECYNLMHDCWLCSNGNVCDRCNDGYFWTSTYGCIQCYDTRTCYSYNKIKNIPGCFASDDGVTCHACNGGFLLNAGLTCDPQPVWGCIKYSASDKNICEQCEAYAYLNTLGNGCIMCINIPNAHCETCSSSTACTSCTRNKGLYGTSCIDCGTTNCAICADSSNCAKCHLGYWPTPDPNLGCIQNSITYCDEFTDYTHCKTPSAGYALSCVKCGNKPIENCECSNTAGNFCMKCKKGFIVNYDGSCGCGVAGCALCNQDDGSICDQCEDGPDFYVRSDDFKTCIPCDPMCQGCEGSADQCKSCKDDGSGNVIFELTPNSVLGTCKCISRYGWDDTIDLCVECHALCKTCSGSDDSSCMSCESDRTLTPASGPGQCLCNDGTYPDGSNVCQPCDKSCSKCNTSPEKCTQCKDPTMTKTIGGSPTYCACQPGKFFSYDTEKCEDCDPTCKTCKGRSIDCLICTDSSITPLEAPSPCNCPEKTYFDLIAKVCTSCTKPCGNCEGANSNQCTSCMNSNFTPSSASATFSCDCSPGYNFDGVDGCTLCDPTCDSCSGFGASNCYACKYPPSIMTLTPPSGPGTCTCNSGSFWDSANKICSSCDALCATCAAAGPGNCLTCKDTTHASAPACACPTNSQFSSGSGLCVPDDGYYFGSNPHAPSLCAAPCKFCNSATYCTSCTGIYNTAQSGTCNNCKSQNAVYDPATFDCKCASGYSGTPDSCFKCIDNCSVCSDGITCQQCKIGYYYDNASCKACQAPCKECSSATVCTACLDPAMTITQSGTCTCKDENASLDVATNLCKCNDYYYLNLGTCTNCPGLCKKCSSNTLCTACIANAAVDTTNLCSCGNGYGRSLNTCIPCRTGCAVCTKTIETCNTCVNHASTNSDGTCSCLTGFYWKDTKCVAYCNSLCTACSDDDGTICSACIVTAELSKTKCSCTAFSTYSSTAGLCVCNSGYTMVNNKCVACKNYLALSDVTDGSYDAYFATITVTFGVGINTSVSAACANTIDWQSVNKLGTGASCAWVGSNKLKITLGKSFTIRLETLYLLGTNIVKATGTCSLNYTPLTVNLRQTVDSTPTAIISGPTSYSLDCGTTALTYSGSKSTGNFNNPFTYTWSATSTPSNSGVTSYIATQTSSAVTITKLLFTSNTDASLVVTLTVTNIFGGINSASLTTSIKAAPSLQVLFDSGTFDTMKSSDTRTYKASVGTYCDSSVSSVTWTWSYVALSGTPSIDSSSILSASQMQSKLLINSNKLPAGYTYQFNATAVSQSSAGPSVSGYSLLSITVTASPLKIKLSKSNSMVASLDGFSINGDGSYDPDNSTTILSYQWSCLYSSNLSTCIGTDNKDLVSSVSTSSLSFSPGKMIPGASYDLTLLIKSGDRNASATVTVEVSTSTVASSSSIQIPYTLEKSSADGYYIVSPSVTIASGSTIKWTCDNSSIIISPDTLSVISIPPGTFAEGNTYKFNFIVTESAGNTISSSIVVDINRGAICDGVLDISPSSGTALNTLFTISISGCYDQDGEDYPLTYKYDDIWNSVDYVLGTSQDSSISTHLFANTNLMTIKVCDQLSSCSSYSSSIIVNSARLLEQTDYASLYASQTLDPDNIPSEISLICSSAVIDNTLFSQMWSDLKSYASSQTIISTTLYKSFCAAVLALSSQTACMTASLYMDFMNWLIDILNTHSIPINTDAKNILDIAKSFSEGYLEFASKNSNKAMPYESYLLNSDKLLSIFMVYITIDDLPGQNSIPSSESTSYIQLNKVREFPSTLNGTKNNFGIIDVTFPSAIPLDDTYIMNCKANVFNLSDDYSPWFSLGYSVSGSYQNYQYTNSSDQYLSFRDDRYPVSITLPYYKNSTHGLSCYYYNNETAVWEINGCVIINQTSDTITVNVTHFSLFKISETESTPYVPPTVYESSCGDNYAPIIIMIVGFFIGFVVMAISVIVDKRHLDKLEKNRKRNTSECEFEMNANNDSPLKPNEVEYIDTEKKDEWRMEVVDHSDKLEQHHNSKNDIQSKNKIDVDKNSPKEEEQHTPTTPPVIIATKELELEHSHLHRGKGCLRLLLEGHLTFGLIYYRRDLPRWRRVLILFTVIIFELLLEGCLLFGFEDTDKGREMSTQSIFDNYEGNFLGYTVLAVLIACHLELFLLSFSNARRRKTITVLASLFGAAVITGSIIGIVILNLDFCFNWSGYWAESFLWGVLMEIFVIQVFYMLCRYVVIMIKSKGDPKSSSKVTL